MKLNFVVAVFSAVILSAGVSSGALLQSYDGLGPVRDREFRQALGLYGRGMYRKPHLPKSPGRGTISRPKATGCCVRCACQGTDTGQ